MALNVEYKDALFDGQRRYQIAQNDDGTYTILDVTTYTQEGDRFGAADINATNGQVNRLSAEPLVVTFLSSGWSSSAPYTQTVAAEGLTADDTPTPMFVDDGTTKSASKAKQKAYGYISYFESGDGTVTATCKYEKPTTDFMVGLKGV